MDSFLADQMILTHLREPILFVNSEGLVIQGNDAAFSLLNRKEEEQVNISGYLDFNTLKGKQKIHTLMELEDKIIEVKSLPVDDNHYCLLLNEISLQEKAMEIKNYIQYVTDTFDEGIVMYHNQKILDCDPQFAAIFGYEADELKGMDIGNLFADQSISCLQNKHKPADELLELNGVKKDGKEIYVEMAEHPYHHNGNIVRVALVRDITERIKNEKRMEYIAYYDEVTDLPNYKFFTKVLNEAIKEAKSSNESLAVYYIDLNYFKEINDTFGYEFGNRLLKTCGNKFKSFLQTDTFIARDGGDEFLILKRNVKDEQEAKILAEKLISEFEKPIRIDDFEIYTSLSIGISIYPEHGRQASELLKHADSAMYVVKEARRNNYKLFDNSIAEDFKKMLLMESDLRRAVKENQFELHYQPQKNIKTGKLVGMEALLRWNHPEKGYIPPTEFVPLAEKSGLIIEIGDWVIRKACEQNKKWQDEGFEPITVSVNLSAKQLHQKDFVDKIKRILEETGLESKYLELEITESMAMSNEEYILRTLRELRKIGVNVSIDDFGTGYSSLKYLSLFPVTKLKIDKMFMDDTLNHNKQIVKSIINMSHSLKMRVIAEGVETEEQMKFLENEKCDEIQGYYFSKPLPPAELKDFLPVV